MQKLIILASLAICCCLAAPTTERANAEKDKQVPKESLLVHPIADTESEGHPEHEGTKPQQTPAVILLHREKRENSEEKEDESKPAPTKFLGIQNLRGELSPEEQTEDKEDHDQHETKEEKRPKRENSEEKEDEPKPALTKFLGIQNLRGELSPEEQTEHKEAHDQHETEEEKRPKRENSEEKEDESKPAPTKFLGIQNLRGELSPEEQTEHKEEEEQTHNVSEDEKRPKREDTETKEEEDETKAATSHFIGIQNLRGELSPEEVTELKKEHAQHEAEEEKRPKRKSVETEVKEEETKAATTVKESEHEELSPEEDIEDKEYHAHHQVEDEKRPKRESTEVKEDEQKPTTTQFIGIQNLRGELSPEEQTQHEADAAHHQVEEDEKRSKREGDATTPATTTDEAAIPQTLPEELPTHHLTKEQKRQEAAHLLLTNVNGARRRRDIPVPLVPKHQHNEQENQSTSPKPAHDYDEIQVEDLSDGTPPTHKVEHAAGSSTPKPSTTTTQHPLIRLHPVSVAELFNRPKPQAAAGTEKSEA